MLFFYRILSVFCGHVNGLLFDRILSSPLCPGRLIGDERGMVEVRHQLQHRRPHHRIDGHGRQGVGVSERAMASRLYPRILPTVANDINF